MSTIQEISKNTVMTVLRSLMAARGLPAPRSGWLKISREQARLSTREVGRRLEMSHQAISHFEEAERKGRITLANLRRVADAMGCELVYGIVPKAKPEEAAGKAGGSVASALSGLFTKPR